MTSVKIIVNGDVITTVSDLASLKKTDNVLVILDQDGHKSTFEPISSMKEQAAQMIKESKPFGDVVKTLIGKTSPPAPLKKRTNRKVFPKWFYPLPLIDTYTLGKLTINWDENLPK